MYKSWSFHESIFHEIPWNRFLDWSLTTSSGLALKHPSLRHTLCLESVFLKKNTQVLIMTLLQDAGWRRDMESEWKEVISRNRPDLCKMIDTEGEFIDHLEGFKVFNNRTCQSFKVSWVYLCEFMVSACIFSCHFNLQAGIRINHLNYNNAPIFFTKKALDRHPQFTSSCPRSGLVHVLEAADAIVIDVFHAFGWK